MVVFRGLVCGHEYGCQKNLYPRAPADKTHNEYEMDI